LAFVKMNVQFIRIAALGLTMIFASRVWPDR